MWKVRVGGREKALGLYSAGQHRLSSVGAPHRQDQGCCCCSWCSALWGGCILFRCCCQGYESVHRQPLETPDTLSSCCRCGIGERSVAWHSTTLTCTLGRRQRRMRTRTRSGRSLGLWRRSCWRDAQQSASQSAAAAAGAANTQLADNCSSRTNATPHRLACCWRLGGPMQLHLLSIVCAGRGVDSCSRSSLFPIVSYHIFCSDAVESNDPSTAGPGLQ